MPRAIVQNLGAPAGSRVVADFTNGSIPASQIVTDSGFPNAAGRSYSYDSRGIQIAYTGGTAGQYASAKWEPAAGGGGTIDLSGSDWIGLELEFPDGTAATRAAIDVFLTTQTGTTYTNYQNRTIASGSIKCPTRQVMMMRLTDSWTKVGGGPTSFATLGKFEVRLQVPASLLVPGNVFVRKIHVGRNRPKVVLSFDDLRDGQINFAFPTLAAAGIKAGLCISPSYVGQAGHLTLANMQTLYAAGWDFGVQQFNDSAEIPVNYAGTTGLTSDGLGTATWVNIANLPHNLVAGQGVVIKGAASPNYNGSITVLTTPNAFTFTYAITGTPTTPDPGWATCPRGPSSPMMGGFVSTLNWLKANGFTRGNFFAGYSNGVTDEDVEANMPGLGFTMCRTTQVNCTPNIGFDPRAATAKSFMRLPGSTMDQQTSAAVLALVDTCINRGCSLMLYGHDIDPVGAALTITQSEWSAVAAGIILRRNQGLIDVVSPTEFMQQMVGSAVAP